MSTISRVTTWTSGQTLTASALNGEFNNIVNAWNNVDAGSSTWTNVNATTITGTTITATTLKVTNQKRFGMSNLVIVRNGATPTTKLDITADYLDVEYVPLTTVSLTGVDITVVGANGLDTGSAANSTGYYVWAIYNETTTTAAGLISLSATAPTLPSGYGRKRRLAYVYRDSGGAFIDFRLTNDICSWWTDIDTNYRSMNGLPTTGAWTDQTLATGTSPALECEVFIGGQIIATAGGSAAFILRPKGAAWTNGGSVGYLFAPAASQSIQGRASIIQNSTRVIQYNAGANVSSVVLAVLGYRMPQA